MDIDEYRTLLKHRDAIQKQIDHIESEFSNSKLFHIDAYILVHDEYGQTIENVIGAIERNSDDIHITVAKSEEKDLLWYDDIDLNRIDCPIENYQKYFENNN